MAFLHCYIACQSFTNDDFIKWNEDLFSLLTREALSLRTNGYMILAMGDFNSKIGQIPGLEDNSPIVNRNEPMFNGFITDVNLYIINTLPICHKVFTRFDGDKKSLLDYGLIYVDHVHCVRSFTIDEDARFACGSDHALIECVISFETSPRLRLNYDDILKYNFNDRTDFTRYKNILERTLASISLQDFEKLELPDKLNHITQSINNTAAEVFGKKIKTKRKRGVRLPKTIRNSIKQKEIVLRKLHEAYSNGDSHEVRRLQSELLEVKEKVSNGISDMRVRKRRQLRAKLLLDDPNRKKFWRFVRNQVKKIGQIGALRDKVGILRCNYNNNQ